MKEQREFLDEILCGDAEAVALCEMLGGISQVWDDLIDGDAEVSAAEINQAFFAAIVELPANPFYFRHFARLHPLIASAVFDWMASNELEKTGSHDRTLAFVLRDNLSAVVTQCASITGGYAWAQQNAARIRRYFHDETLQDYLGGLR